MPSILHLRAAWGKGGGLPLCCFGGAHEEANYIPDEGRLAAKPTGDPSFGIIASTQALYSGRVNFGII